jgi:hypothetical protein
MGIAERRLREVHIVRLTHYCAAVPWTRRLSEYENFRTCATALPREESLTSLSCFYSFDSAHSLVPSRPPLVVEPKPGIYMPIDTFLRSNIKDRHRALTPRKSVRMVHTPRDEFMIGNEG